MIRIQILVILFSLSSFASAQFFSKQAFSVNHGWGIGLLGGRAELNEPYDKYKWGFGVSLTIKGFHAHVFGWINGEDHTHDVRVQKWTNEGFYVYHIGYQVPLSKTFRIIPLIGAVVKSSTFTDGSDWTIKDNQIQNAQYTDSHIKFDYGCMAVVKIWKHTKLSIAYTRHSLFGGISWEWLSKKYSDKSQ